MTKNILILLSATLLFSCKSSYVSVQVMKPAQITVPSGIQSFAIVNRSRPLKQERARNILEGVITGEVPFVDRFGAEECVKGLANALSNSPRFKAILPGGVDLRGTGTREFPHPLDWNFVTDFCKKNNVDALIALETFDSNNRYDMRERQVERKEKEQIIKYIEYTASLNVQVDAGWRIYYPAQNRIVDQNVFSDHKGWSSSNDARKRAEQGLPSQDRAVSEAGYFSGEQYAFRISPRWISVSREYYKKGNADFELATRKAQVNDWKGAAELWQKQTRNSDPKLAGNACFNMALACEMEGALDAALDWAKKAYVDYKNKKARNYMYILEGRISDQNRLDEQMKGVQ